MLTDFYNISTVYWVYVQHNHYLFTYLTYVLLLTLTLGNIGCSLKGLTGQSCWIYVEISFCVSTVDTQKLIFVRMHEPHFRQSWHQNWWLLLLRRHTKLQQMLSSIRSIAGDENVFQQDSAPAHRARQTVELLQCKTHCSKLMGFKWQLRCGEKFFPRFVQYLFLVRIVK